MEQEDVKPQNLPKHLRSLLDSPPAQGIPSISKLITDPYETDPIPGKIPEAILTKNGLQEITISECVENGGQI